MGERECHDSLCACLVFFFGLRQRLKRWNCTTLTSTSMSCHVVQYFCLSTLCVVNISFCSVPENGLISCTVSFGVVVSWCHTCHICVLSATDQDRVCGSALFCHRTYWAICDVGGYGHPLLGRQILTVETVEATAGKDWLTTAYCRNFNVVFSQHLELEKFH